MPYPLTGSNQSVTEIENQRELDTTYRYWIRLSLINESLHYSIPVMLERQPNFYSIKLSIPISDQHSLKFVISYINFRHGGIFCFQFLISNHMYGP